MLPSLSALAADGEEVEVSLKKTAITIGDGEIVNLYDLIADADRDENEYTFLSENESAVVVTGGGLAEGVDVGNGAVQITRHYYEEVEGNEGEEPQTVEHTVSSTINITVKKAPAQIILNAHSLALGKNDTFDFDSKIKGGYSYSREFSVSDSSIATVDSKGIVRAKTTGTVTVTVRSYNNLTDSCTVTFMKSTPKLTITSKNTKIQKGANIHKILYKTAPAGDFGKITFVSSDKKLAKIDASGYVTGVRTGSATVTVKTKYENVFATQKLTVVDNALNLNCNSAQLALDQAHVQRVRYGTSVQKRMLEAYIITNKSTGKYKKTLFMDFAVHGFEDSYARDGKKLVEEANKLIKYFTFHSDLLGEYRLVIVPCANPDGTIAGKNNQRACATAFGRCTAKHVDMNRDFVKFRAVESRKLRDFIKKSKPNVYLNMHGWLNESMGSYSLSKIINKAQGFSKYIGAYAYNEGYIIGWVNAKLKIPAALVEYKSPGTISTKRDITMIKNIIKAY